VYGVSAKTEVYGMCSAPQAVNNKSTADELQEKDWNSFQPKQHTCCQSSVLLISRLLAAGTLDLSSHMCRVLWSGFKTSTLCAAASPTF